MFDFETFDPALPHQTPLLGTCDRVRLNRFTCLPGSVFTSTPYTYPSVTRMYLLFAREGYIISDSQVFSLDEPALFVPDASVPFSIHAGKSPLILWEIETDMNQEDQLQLSKSHMVFPRFRPFSSAWEHTMAPINHPDSATQGFVLIENRKLGANNMGLLSSKRSAAAHVSPFAMKAYDQFFFPLEDCDCTAISSSQNTHLKADNIIFLPHGEPISFISSGSGRIHLVWLALNRSYDPEFQEVCPQ